MGETKRTWRKRLALGELKRFSSYFRPRRTTTTSIALFREAHEQQTERRRADGSSLSLLTSTSSSLSSLAWVCGLCILSLVCGFAGVVEARCEKNFTLHSEASLCAPYVDYDYFLPDGPTNWIIDALVSYQVNLGTLRSTLLPAKCEEKFIPLVCAQTYPKCTVKKDGTTTTLPVCQSLCTEAVEACEGLLPQLPDCNTTGISRDGEECFKVDNNETIPFPFECGYPMHYDSRAEDTIGFPCALQCPVPLYDQDELEAVWIVLLVLHPVAFVVIVVFFACQLYQWRYWFNFPKQYVVFNTFFIVIQCCSLMIPVFEGGYAAATCKSHSQPAQGDKFSCTLMHWLLYVGAWGGNCCFLIISLNVLLTLLSKIYKFSLDPYLTKLHVVYISWSLMVIPIMIVMQILGDNGYGYGLGSCFFKSHLVGESQVDLSQLLFIVIPFSTQIAISYICLAAVIFFVIKVSGWRRLREEVLFALFPFLYGIPISLTTVPSWTRVIRSDSTQSNDYLSCKVQNWVESLFASYQPVTYQKCNIDNGIGRTDHFNFFYGLAIVDFHFVVLIVFFFGKDVYRQFNPSTEVRTSSSAGSSRLPSSLKSSFRRPFSSRRTRTRSPKPSAPSTQDASLQ